MWSTWLQNLHVDTSGRCWVFVAHVSHPWQRSTKVRSYKSLTGLVCGKSKLREYDYIWDRNKMSNLIMVTNVLMTIRIDYDIQVIDDKFMLCSKQNTPKYWTYYFLQTFLSKAFFTNKCNFFQWKCLDFDKKKSLNFVPNCPTDHKYSMVRVMALRRTGDKPLNETKMNQFNDAY